MKYTPKLTRTIVAAVVAMSGTLFLSFAMPALAHAHGSDANSTSRSVAIETATPERIEAMKAEAEQRTADAKARFEKTRAEAERRKAEAKAKAEARLAETKLRICERRETTINNLMDRIGSRGQRHIAVFNKISERVQAFYKDKGLTVANYDALVADVAAAKATAETAAAAVKDAQVTFACDGSDPRGAADSFKALMQARNDAIKAYKDSVRALLVAVKSAQANSSTASEASQGRQ